MELTTEHNDSIINNYSSLLDQGLSSECTHDSINFGEETNLVRNISPNNSNEFIEQTDNFKNVTLISSASRKTENKLNGLTNDLEKNVVNGLSESQKSFNLDSKKIENNVLLDTKLTKDTKKDLNNSFSTQKLAEEVLIENLNLSLSNSRPKSGETITNDETMQQKDIFQKELQTQEGQKGVSVENSSIFSSQSRLTSQLSSTNDEFQEQHILMDSQEILEKVSISNPNSRPTSQHTFSNQGIKEQNTSAPNKLQAQDQPEDVCIKNLNMMLSNSSQQTLINDEGKEILNCQTNITQM
uniref:Uncharacterized protein n=1 Tax=Clastoptera arizonana TaxID=38151 RepID=A0A1B6EG00_9HEMI